MGCRVACGRGPSAHGIAQTTALLPHHVPAQKVQRNRVACDIGYLEHPPLPMDALDDGRELHLPLAAGAREPTRANAPAVLPIGPIPYQHSEYTMVLKRDYAQPLRAVARSQSLGL